MVSSIVNDEIFLAGTTTPCQSGPGSNIIEGVFFTPKLLNWSLTIRCFMIISRTLIGRRILLLSRDTFSIFYSYNQLGCIKKTSNTLFFKFATIHESIKNINLHFLKSITEIYQKQAHHHIRFLFLSFVNAKVIEIRIKIIKDNTGKVELNAFKQYLFLFNKFNQIHGNEGVRFH